MGRLERPLWCGRRYVEVREWNLGQDRPEDLRLQRVVGLGRCSGHSHLVGASGRKQRPQSHRSYYHHLKPVRRPENARMVRRPSRASSILQFSGPQLHVLGCTGSERGNGSEMQVLPGWLHQIDRHCPEIVGTRHMRGYTTCSEDEGRRIARSPVGAVLLFCVLSAVTFNILSHLNFHFVQGQMPRHLYDLTARVVLVVYLGYCVPLSFIRPVALWRRYPSYHNIFAVVVALPGFLVLVVCVLAFL